MKTILITTAAAGLSLASAIWALSGAPIQTIPASGVPAAIHAPATKPVMDLTVRKGRVVPDALRPHLDDIAKEYGIDPAILGAVAYKESHFKAKVCSAAGACGLMQFMPDTAEQYRVDRDDPVSSLRGAAKYLSFLVKLHDGNLGLALASYNWGEGNVTKWRAKGSKINKMPQETQDYVKRITGISVAVWAGKAKSVGEVLANIQGGDLIQTVGNDL